MTTSWVLLLLSGVATWVNRLVLLPLVESIESKMGPISVASTAIRTQFFMYHGISMALDLLAIIMVTLFWACITFGMCIEWD